MADQSNRGGVGGAANEVGSIFRARLGAWIATHALVGRPLPGIGLPVGADVPTGVVLFEGDGRIDDLQAELREGAVLYAQAKHSLEVSGSPKSEFAKAARQFAQFAQQSAFDPDRARLVLAVGRSTGPLRALQRALARRRQPRRVADTPAERRALGTWTAHLHALSDTQRDALLRASAGGGTLESPPFDGPGGRAFRLRDPDGFRLVIAAG